MTIRHRDRATALARLRAPGSAVQTLSVVAAVAVVALVSAGLTSALHDFAISTLINVIIVVGLYVFVGNSGIVSFGHISFMAIGAYATGLLTVAPGQKGFLLPDLPHWVATLHLGMAPAAALVVVVAIALAAVVGLPLMRLSGIAATIATLALILVVNVVIVQTTAWTGGNQAFIGVPLTTTPEVAVLCMVLVVGAAWAFDRSGVGLRLRASREDEPAARAAGISVMRERVIAFALSGGIVALAGVLYAHFLGSFDPPSFYLELTFITLAMLVVGGMFSLVGAIAGALVLSGVQEVLGRLENGEGLGPIHLQLHDGTTDVVLAVIVIAIMIFRPGGIMGGVSRRAGRG